MGITHSVEAVQGSSRAEDRLRLVIDPAPALIHTSLPDGYLDFFNQTWLNYLGLPGGRSGLEVDGCNSSRRRHINRGKVAYGSGQWRALRA